MMSLSGEAQRGRKEELWEIPWIQKMRTAPRFVGLLTQQHTVGSMLVHRLRRRWPNIEPTMGQLIVFAE